ncbi:MAG TPA: hypothetical protein VL793_04640, partial [Patescibacteria group bacterium]|nr:hypothetical protein [Patescibacteria group bacterium]
MSLGVSRLGRWLLLFGFAASGLLVTHARAQGTQSQRRFPGLSETNNSQLLTNLNRLTIKKDGVTELEEQLRSLREGTTRNPMERHFNVPYVPPPSTGPVLPSKAVQ